jgi:myo-inositol-1(or 4)-monophosphatase
VHDIQEKGEVGDLVTEADKKSEQVILDSLERYFPSHKILAEESGGASLNGSEFVWVVDPLDGTTNYAHQFPFVAVSIGLLYRNEPVLGVIYNPILNELFQTAKGLGAKAQGQSIHVSKTAALQNSLLATGFAYNRRHTLDNNYAEFCRFTHLTQGVRRAGAASLDLAYVAMGRLDGYWENGLKPWDIAAGAILVREAGGIVSDYDASNLKLESGRILASNPLLHANISHELMQFRKSDLQLTRIKDFVT